MKSLSAIGRIRCAVGALLVVTGWALSPTALAQDIQYDNFGDSESLTDCSEVDGCGDEVYCGDCVAGCCSQGYGDYFWIEGDYLLLKTNGSGLPPLVTAAPLGTPQPPAGRLGDPSTTILSGGHSVSDDWRSGYRISGGIWLDHCTGLALVGDYFNAGRDSFGFSNGPSGSQIITRPFFNTQAGVQDAEGVNTPGQFTGTVSGGNFADFQGAGIGLQQCLYDCGCCCDRQQLMLVGGYRYYQHDSQLVINEDITFLPGNSTPILGGTNILVQDRFRANNEFNGGELGVQGRVWRSKFFFDGLVKVAVGANHRTVVIDGFTTNTVPGSGTSTSAGGLLTSEVTNIGRYSDTVTSVIPHFRLGVGYQLTPHFSVKTGYNVILWNGVVQAASALPPGLASDPRNLPPVQAGGGPDPRFPGIQGTNFVAHGLDFGVQFAY